MLHLVGEGTGTEVVVRGRLSSSEAAEPVMVAVWQDMLKGRVVFRLERTEEHAEVRLMLDRLAEAAVTTYLDARIRFTKQGVVADLPADRMADELEAMVIAAADQLAAGHGFTGFSLPTRQQLDRLTRIDWSKASMAVDAGQGQDKYLAIYYYLRSQRDELDRQLRADLLPLAGVPVLGEAAGGDAEIRIGSVCGTVFDDQNYLCALDLKVAGGDVPLDPVLAQRMGAPAVAEEPVRLRKRDRWLKAELEEIHQRIDAMDQHRDVRELRDRVEDVEDRISGLELEVMDVRERAVGAENPLADLSHLAGRNITIRFNRNAVGVSPANEALLSEVVDQLLRSPEERVLITGYSDRSGDPAMNMRLSERRAKAVRDHLLRQGVEPERLLINYFGDSRSAGRDPSERRVEVEWVRMR